MYKRQNFCHVASNNRNQVKVGVFVYRTTDDLATVSASGYFNESIIDINLHDLIIHEQIDAADNTKITTNLLCVTERTLENIGTTVALSDWEKQAEEIFVKTDGSSVMSGALKFSAGSFRGAISGGLNGVTFFKMDSQGTLTQIASLSNTQFVPSSDNTLEIGNSLRKIKNIYAGKLNNGADIDIQSKAGTMALMSDVELAANSGSQLWTTGVWYAKMYSETVAPAAEDGTNYADFSQTDVGGNPIIVIYERQNGAWVQIDTVTPPETYNGYLYVTSKIWDIAEQSGQQGGQILWSHSNKTFTPYPRIISFEDIEVTGDSTVVMPATPSQNQIVNKQYVDNNANPLKYASNCIIEKPTNINITLSGGTLTLKAGSKVGKPNGSGVFDVLTITEDKTKTISANDIYMIFWVAAGFVETGRLSRICSGSSDTLMGTAYHIWYDTTNNIISKYDSDGTTVLTTGLSFPIAKVTVSGGAISSIDEVYNDFGSIGSVIFSLPGVKGLVPDGRNSDGSLNNEFSTSSVASIIDPSALSDGSYELLLNSNGLSYTSSINQYDEPSNKNTVTPTYHRAGEFTVSSGSLSGLIIDSVYHSVNYSDFSDLQTVVSGKADLNLQNATSENDFVIERQVPTAGNNYTWYRKYRSGWVEQGGYKTNSATSVSITLPITMSDTNYVAIGQVVGSNTTNVGTKVNNDSTTQITVYAPAANDIMWLVSGIAAL